MKTFTTLLTACLLACGPAFAQDASTQKSSASAAEIIIKVQDVKARTATPFTDKINAIEGMEVQATCKSDTKPMIWYVRVQIDRLRYQTLDEALEVLSNQKISFKRIDKPASEFDQICDNG